MLKVGKVINIRGIVVSRGDTSLERMLKKGEYIFEGDNVIAIGGGSTALVNLSNKTDVLVRTDESLFIPKGLFAEYVDEDMIDKSQMINLVPKNDNILDVPHETDGQNLKNGEAYTEEIPNLYEKSEIVEIEEGGLVSEREFSKENTIVDRDEPEISSEYDKADFNRDEIVASDFTGTNASQNEAIETPDTYKNIDEKSDNRQRDESLEQIENMDNLESENKGHLKHSQSDTCIEEMSLEVEKEDAMNSITEMNEGGSFESEIAEVKILNSVLEDVKNEEVLEDKEILLNEDANLMFSKPEYDGEATRVPYPIQKEEYVEHGSEFSCEQKDKNREYEISLLSELMGYEADDKDEENVNQTDSEIISLDKNSEELNIEEEVNFPIPSEYIRKVDEIAIDFSENEGEDLPYTDIEDKQEFNTINDTAVCGLSEEKEQEIDELSVKESVVDYDVKNESVADYDSENSVNEPVVDEVSADEFLEENNEKKETEHQLKTNKVVLEEWENKEIEDDIAEINESVLSVEAKAILNDDTDIPLEKIESVTTIEDELEKEIEISLKRDFIETQRQKENEYPISKRESRIRRPRPRTDFGNLKNRIKATTEDYTKVLLYSQYVIEGGENLKSDYAKTTPNLRDNQKTSKTTNPEDPLFNLAGINRDTIDLSSLLVDLVPTERITDNFSNNEA